MKEKQGDLRSVFEVYFYVRKVQVCDILFSYFLSDLFLLFFPHIFLKINKIIYGWLLYDIMVAYQKW